MLSDGLFHVIFMQTFNTQIYWNFNWKQIWMWKRRLFRKNRSFYIFNSLKWIDGQVAMFTKYLHDFTVWTQAHSCDSYRLRDWHCEIPGEYHIIHMHEGLNILLLHIDTGRRTVDQVKGIVNLPLLLFSS